MLVSKMVLLSFCKFSPTDFFILIKLKISKNYWEFMEIKLNIFLLINVDYIKGIPNNSQNLILLSPLFFLLLKLLNSLHSEFRISQMNAMRNKKDIIEVCIDSTMFL